jgi:hypothetical protein
LDIHKKKRAEPGAETPGTTLTKVPIGRQQMATPEVTKKLHIYHTLYRLNLSFSNIVGHCHALQEARGLTAKSSRVFQGYAQELQAEINQELLERMHDGELEDWARFGKIRLAEEKRLRDPADILIQAEEYKRSVKKKKKVPQKQQRQRSQSK